MSQYPHQIRGKTINVAADVRNLSGSFTWPLPKLGETCGGECRPAWQEQFLGSLQLQPRTAAAMPALVALVPLCSALPGTPGASKGTWY